VGPASAVTAWSLARQAPRAREPRRVSSVASTISGWIEQALDWLVPSAQAATLPGAGHPILLITSASATFSSFYTEILNTEGLNLYDVADISTVTSATLSNYPLVILSQIALSGSQVTMFTNYVNAGGNLIAMRPDPQLASLLGLTSLGTLLSNAYLLVDTSQSPGNGIVGQVMQFHGTADLYALNGASSVATLYSNPTTPTVNPAVTLNSVGNTGGHAAAFVYDFATSIVYMRQGNPAWASQERDGLTPIRSDDKFFGDAVNVKQPDGSILNDPEPDWVDLTDEVTIPQADEQQRLLANLMLDMSLIQLPLPRFWYFPNGKQAVVIMTGDDHVNGGTGARFDQYIADSPAGCNVANWECVRATSNIYPETQLLTPAQASNYVSQGFEVSMHLNTNCADFTQASLDTLYTQQTSAFASAYPQVPAPKTQRHHCIAWSDWVTGAKEELKFGMRLDTSYYFWPPSWLQDRPGYFTGSAMPMRFADLNGSIIDVYNATTQMTDESGQSYPRTSDALLGAAVGPQGYYGAYTVNAHTDWNPSPVSDAVVNSAQSRGIPIVSQVQMLNWLDARNGSSLGKLGWDGSNLSFTLTPGAGANGLQAMVPTHVPPALALATITGPSGAVALTTSDIKGVGYAFFPAAAGTYTAAYVADTTQPTVIATSPVNGGALSPSGTVTATFSKVMNPASINANDFMLRGPASESEPTGPLIPATVTYVPPRATLLPNSALAAGTTYSATVNGGMDLSGNALASPLTWSFTTTTPPSCPCDGFSSSATPKNPSANDSNAIEVGVKFKVDVAGYINGIRFYKGAANTGTHIGNLWTLPAYPNPSAAPGSLLASATFTNETASGWQQVTFSNPVPVLADTVYVASYFAPNGNYAADLGFFATSGVDNPPVHLLQDGIAGGDGVFSYGASSTFPSSSFKSANYWVDVLFTPGWSTPAAGLGVTTSTPTIGQTGVDQLAPVSATFNKALKAATVNTLTFTLKAPSGALVAATVGAAGNTATLTPSTPLAPSTSYTATLTTGVQDVSGEALAVLATWSFTTGGLQNCPCGAWTSATTPGTPSSGDTNAVEVGVKFRVDEGGTVSGVRFYKAANNTGTHIGNLWTLNGQLLATATFTNETASGWQQVNFSNPVSIGANTVYIASYFAPKGNYAADNNYFSSTGVDNPPVHLLQDGVSGGDGVYTYGASSAFPTLTFQASNYWVDVVFTPSVTTTTPTFDQTGVGVATGVSATFSSALNPATVTSSTFTLTGPGNAPVAATLTASGNTATLTPTSPLAFSTTYTATLTTGIQEANGNSLSANYSWSFTTAPNTSACASPPNAIVAENCQPGQTGWDVSGGDAAGDTSIQGFATDLSVNQGGTVTFKVDTTAKAYQLDIYRMGYYGGAGARKVATVLPSATLPQAQPACLTDNATGLLDCGNWAVSASWNVPANATSGIYFARVMRPDTGGASHIVFIVRNDASHSDLLFQTSDTTWQAYNDYGGQNLYGCNGAFNLSCRAFKVSYNRPFHTRAFQQEAVTWVFNAEYPMVRWLEANGYDVSYFTDIDTERNAALIKNHKGWISNGHDEYWSAGARSSVTAARDAGVHLAFFSGNTMFWKTRWENSIDGSATPMRTLVCYKETAANAVIDPLDPPTWTGTWRDTRFSPPADGGQPENAVMGTLFRMNGGQDGTITVPQADGQMRFWRNTPAASQGPGQLALAPGTIGAEFDDDEDNGFRPAGLIELSNTSITDPNNFLIDFGSIYGSGTAIHKVTLYKAKSGALVFATGTYQWAWGLDANHDNADLGSTTDIGMQQATVNLFADMGVQPATLQSGLTTATQSTDVSPPTSTITAPANNASLPANNLVVISGTATDAGGGVVAGVEVSIDGGKTWHPATGRASWSYNWIPRVAGSYTLLSRAVDDSGNLETPGAGVTVSVPTPSITGCGLNVELAPLLPVLLWLRGRRRRTE